MYKTIKRIFSKSSIFIFTIITLFLAKGNVQATWHNFDGYAKVGFNVVDRKVMCNDNKTTSWVNVYTVSVPSNIWYRINESYTGEEVGRALIRYTGEALFPTSTAYGHRYSLYAGREFFYDAPAHVTGRWRP